MFCSAKTTDVLIEIDDKIIDLEMNNDYYEKYHINLSKIKK